MVVAAEQRDAALQAENDKLRLLIQKRLRHQFGRRSEQLDPDQLQLGLEDLEQAVAELQVIGEDRSEMLDLVPAQLRVRVIRRPG